MPRRAPRMEELPIYADDLAIGAAILGPARASEWKAMAPLLEARGLPKIDAMHGGRYVPGVATFYGVPFALPTSTTPPVSRGVERAEGLWSSRRRQG